MNTSCVWLLATHMYMANFCKYSHIFLNGTVTIYVHDMYKGVYFDRDMYVPMLALVRIIADIMQCYQNIYMCISKK